MKAEEAWYSNSYAEKKTKEESERNYQNYEKHKGAFNAESIE